MAESKGKTNGATKPAAKPSPSRPPPSAKWQNLFVLNRERKPASTVANVILALSHDDAWKGVLAYSTFVGDIVCLKPPPWKGILKPGEDAKTVKSEDYYWTDRDTTRTAAWLANRFGLLVQSHTVAEALEVVAEQVKMHPVRDWLSDLKWDRRRRLDDWLVRLAGAEDSKYTRAVTSKWMVGLVARVFEPGCMFRMMLILEGPQDIRKSTALRTLAMRDEWFLETSIEMGSKDSYQALRGKWLVEFGELDSLSRSQVSKVKQYVSERTSSYRPSYGRRFVDFRRQCGFAGSTNDSEYLKDETGATRFHPVAVTKSIDIEGLEKEVDQLWAEAVVRFRAGEEPFLRDEGVRREAAQIAESRRQAHPWEDPVMRWLRRLPKPRREAGVTTYEVLVEAVCKEVGQLTRGDEMSAASVLRACGWVLDQRPRDKHTRRRIYREKRVLEVATPDGTKTTDSADASDEIDVDRKTSRKRPSKVGPVGPRSDRESSKSSTKNGKVQLVQLVQPISIDRGGGGEK
jgi:putative DNA primase/helicase